MAFVKLDEKFFRSEGIKNVTHVHGVGFEIETVAGGVVFLTDEMVKQLYEESVVRNE